MTSRIALVIGLSVTAGWVTPRVAHACGGFFCDAGPQPMPVDQTGEDILFVATDDGLEAHIRIEYEGDPENFGWVIPVLSEPLAMEVGSEPFFDAIKAASVPTYGFSTTRDACEWNGAFSGNQASPTSGSDQDESGGRGVDVLERTKVGSFELVVIQASNAGDLIDWLDENGYQQDPEAEPILAEYIAEDHKFVGVKLRGGVGLEELHPIVLRFQHDCRCG